jgi:integrase
MPKVAKTLSPIEIKRLTEPGLHAVGEVAGLCLYVKPTGARSWVLRTRANGRRVELGLGGYPTVTAAQARENARTILNDVRMNGADPAAERRARRAIADRTFRKVAEAYIEAHRAGWKNAKHAQQWENTLTQYAYPKIGDKHVAEVGKGDVFAIIEPIWSTKTETAQRLRNRIERVLGYAMQREYRPEGPNPARWKDNLDVALPAKSKVQKVEHMAALPIDRMYGFMTELRKMDGMGARALEFAILTATRSGEVRGAKWSEIDLDNALWTIPPSRMKAGREHRVPLNAAAIDLLQKLPRIDDLDLVFVGKGDKALSDMTLTAALRRMKAGVTAHGFRSTFRDWAAERTSVPHEVAEMALAHAVGDKTEAAYRRGDLFEKRRELMDLWQRFIETPPAKGNVRKLRAA